MSDVVFALVARFPQGTYRGRHADRTPERFPSVARLQAALLCAAGFGPRAVERDGEWSPCAEDETALRWLENNPPTDIRIPPLRVSSNDNTIVYRDNGTIGGSSRAKVIDKVAKFEHSVAVDGEFVWAWRDVPPAPVAAALRELCPDVSHLGSAESPVLLTVTEDVPVATHEHDPAAGMFTGGPGVDVALPLPGHLDELTHAHRAERTGKVGSDKAGTNERAASRVPARDAVRRARYRATRQEASPAPWPEVLLVPLDRRAAERDRVRWAVAAHQAMIKYLDRESPPLLTGVYPEGVRRPANRVALQLLDKDHPVSLPGESALAVLLPTGADPAELDAVYRAVGALRTLRPHRRRHRGAEPERAAVVRVNGPVEAVPGDRFWNAPEPGTVRLWRTEPAAVPDTRGHSEWTFTHAALLSLGFVWQGTVLPTPSGRGAARDLGIVDAVNAAGAAVLRIDPVRDSRVEDFAHKVHRDAVVRPYRATLSLGDLGGPSTIQAIGQCRHLGGGFLVPCDYDEGTVFDEVAQ